MARTAALPATTDAAARPGPDFLDPTGMGHLPAVPLVPEDVLKRHKVFIPTDQRFRSAARLLQALWREDRELPIGSYIDVDEKRTKLGSRITEDAGKQGGNFMSAEIATLVRRECVYRELGALIEVDRLRANLLSSMPLTFNLFAPLKLDLHQATRFINELFPGFMKEVIAIKFEHSPSRGNPRFTADYSAFDVAIYGITPTGQRAFWSVEVKYTEAGAEPLPSRFSDRHFAIASASDLFKEVDDPMLFANPLQQLFREHCLSQSIVENGMADIGIFSLVSPRLNHLTQQMGEIYASHLNPPAPERVPFVSLTLERIIEALALIGLVDHAQALHRRYCDFWLIDGELELEAIKPKSPSKAKKKPKGELLQAS